MIMESKMKNDRVQETITNTLKLIQNDKKLDESKIQDTINAIIQISNATEYIERIKNDIYLALTTQVIGLVEIPIIIKLIIDGINFIKNIDKIDIIILATKETLKYVIYAIMYYIMLEDGHISQLEHVILDGYNNMWNLVTYNLDEITIIEKKIEKEIENIETKCFNCDIMHKICL
ncbi:hypothetical protein BMW23_0709 [Bodo saltans virus]|jgi:hypothetical protein|uniref:Uncharacterized protein n=1 Tax=Bodo saltans virus TaxID=2024608 RepID=A0A2H4UV93_9VIRU|nr:hypothetical protein QJ851_gp0692 [Bodo saltans virus]ATZ80755.1 hypothetical protein BMW23_0709 [Bodo saltans virus]